MRIYFGHFARLAASILCASIGGCALVAVVLDRTSGDPTEPARYVPKKEDMLVLVEDFQNPALIEIVAEQIDRGVAEEFIAHKVAPVINPDRLSLLRTDNPKAYRQMKIVAIGRKLGAKQVAYVDVTDFTVESAVGTPALKARAEARVKIVDCETGQTRWPQDATTAGYFVRVDIPFSAEAENASDAGVRDALARGLSHRIATLFYEATVENSNNAPDMPESGLK